MFQNVAYRATVYRTGVVSLITFIHKSYNEKSMFNQPTLIPLALLTYLIMLQDPAVQADGWSTMLHSFDFVRIPQVQTYLTP